MKYIWLTILVLALSLTACLDDEAFPKKGVITGPDMSMCACCGGWFIQIGEETFRFDKLPMGSGIDLENETFPIKVRLDWKKDEKACISNRIKITRVQRE